MTSAKTEIALKLLSSLTYFASAYSFFWILYDLTWHKPFDLFLYTTLPHWIRFIAFLVLAVVLSVAATNPQVRHFLTHLERKGQKQEQKKKEEKKLSLKTGKVVTEKRKKKEKKLSLKTGKVVTEGEEEEEAEKLPLY